MIDKGVLRQFSAIFAGSMTMMTVGTMIGWTSPIMEELLGPDSPIPMTVEQSSWFTSAITFALVLTSIPCGMLADRWGRKPILQATGPLALATWVALLFVDTFRELLAVRLAQGLLATCAFTVLPVYASEIAGPKIRGALGTMFQIMMYAGVLSAYVAGMWLDYRRLTYAMLAGPVLCCALSAWIPETPHFYALRGRVVEAKRTAAWLRGDDDDGDGLAAAAAVDDGATEALRAECAGDDGAARDASFADLFTDRTIVRSLIIAQCLSMFRVAAGVPAIMFYASVTFAETHVNAPANRLSLVFAGSLLLSALPATALSDRAGRRPLMITSSASCSVLNAIVGAYFYMDRHTSYDVTGHGWVCVAAVGLLCVTYNLGHGALYSTITCELFPSNVRSVANAVNAITLTIACFLAVKIYPVVAQDGGMYLNFVTFSVISMCSAAFCWLWLPETRGMTFAAIQQQLRGGNTAIGADRSV